MDFSAEQLSSGAKKPVLPRRRLIRLAFVVSSFSFFTVVFFVWPNLFNVDTDSGRLFFEGARSRSRSDVAELKENPPTTEGEFNLRLSKLSPISSPATVTPSGKKVENSVTEASPTPSPTSGQGDSSSANSNQSGSVSPTATPTPAARSSVTPTPSTTPSPTPSPTPTATPTPTPSVGLSVSTNSISMNIGQNQKIESVLQITSTGAAAWSFDTGAPTWGGAIILEPSQGSLSLGQTVNVALHTYGQPAGVYNGTAVLRNVANNQSISVSLHITVQ